MASSLTVDLADTDGSDRAAPRPARPRRRSLRERISLGHLFMVAAGLLAFVLVVTVLQDRTVTVSVLVADGDILPGTAITPDLVSEVEIPASSDLVGTLATFDTIAGDTRAGQRIAAGDPITLTAIAPASTPSTQRAMSIPIDRVDAVGGDLGVGDRVDVVAVVDGDAGFVATGLEVLGTQRQGSGGGALGGSTLTTYFVVVAVDADTALAIAESMDNGQVSLVRSTGAVPVEAQPPASPSGESDATDEPGPDDTADG